MSTQYDGVVVVVVVVVGFSTTNAVLELPCENCAQYFLPSCVDDDGPAVVVVV